MTAEKFKTQKFTVEVEFKGNVKDAKEKLEEYLAYGGAHGVDTMGAIGFRVERAK